MSRTKAWSSGPLPSCGRRVRGARHAKARIPWRRTTGPRWPPSMRALRPRSTARRPAPDSDAAILDLACGAGATGALALKNGKCGTYVGVEESGAAAGEARFAITDVLVGKLETVEIPYPAKSFDVLICGAALDARADPATVLARLVPLLRPGARVFAAVAAGSTHDWHEADRRRWPTARRPGGAGRETTLLAFHPLRPQDPQGPPRSSPPTNPGVLGEINAPHRTRKRRAIPRLTGDRSLHAAYDIGEQSANGSLRNVWPHTYVGIRGRCRRRCCSRRPLRASGGRRRWPISGASSSSRNEQTECFKVGFS